MKVFNIEISAGSVKKLLTAGKYVDRDIVITATGGTGIDAEEYEGPTTVTPSAEEQKLATAQKYLAQDITIEKIPFEKIENDDGGLTAKIG